MMAYKEIVTALIRHTLIKDVKLYYWLIYYISEIMANNCFAGFNELSYL